MSWLLFDDFVVANMTYGQTLPSCDPLSNTSCIVKLSCQIFSFQAIFLFLNAGLSNGEIIGIILSTSFGMWILVITMSLCFGVVWRARLSQIVKRQVVTQGQPQLSAIDFNDTTPRSPTNFITTNSTYFNPLYQPDEFDDNRFYYGPNRRNVSS